MATRNWLGRAKPVTDLWTLTVTGPVVIGEVWTVTINGKSISFTATAGTTANVTAGLVALLNNENDLEDAPIEFREYTWADSDPDITATADTPGIPGTISVSTDSAGGSFAAVNTTPATGPNFWSDENNWSGGAVPVNSDDVVIGDSSVSIQYGLAQSGVTLASLKIMHSYDGQIGLPNDSAAGYPEYRDTYLAISATVLDIGEGDGNGSGRIKIDTGSNASTQRVLKTGSAFETELGAVILKGSHASNILNIQSGSVICAPFASETSQYATVNVSNTGSLKMFSTTVAALNVEDGTVSQYGAVGTVTQTGGNLTLLGTGAATTLTVSGGTCLYWTTGTATTVNIGDGPGQAVISCAGDNRDRTWTTTNLKRGGRIDDPHETITHTNDIARGAGVGSVMAA